MIKRNFQKSDREIEAHESREDLKYPQEYVDGGIFILNDLNEKEMNDPQIQAMFKRSRHNNLTIFILSQYYHDLRKRTNRANGSNCQIFKLTNYREVQNLYQDKASMEMT